MNISTQQTQVKIEELFHKLRSKLKSFEVINIEGQKLGQIKDFTLDKNSRLYMVVPKLNSQTDSPVFLLSSKYVQNVDPANRVVFVDISQVELNNLPLYQTSNNSEFSKQSLTALNEESRTKVEKNIQEQQSKVITSSEASDTNAEEIIRLLEERLVINRSSHKIGEIVVRKQIETRIIEVPVKREKLVVEKHDSETQQPIKFEQTYPEYLHNDAEPVHSETLPIAQETSVTNTRVQKIEPEATDSDVVEEEIVRLLEERLVVNRRKWKVGEVVVRKEIETEIVKVPIRREKLIVEQVGTETKILAEIDLAGGAVAQTSSPKLASSHNTVVGEFLSPKAASNLLEAIALQKPHGCKKIRIEIIVENSELQETYQTMFDRCSTS